MLTRVGDIEIWRILESVDPFLTPEQFFGRHEAEELLRAHFPDQLCPKSGQIGPKLGMIHLQFGANLSKHPLSTHRWVCLEQEAGLESLKKRNTTGKSLMIHNLH